MKLLVLSVVSVLILSACGHVNNLGNYDLAEKHVFFEEVVTEDAYNVEIITSDGSNEEAPDNLGEFVTSVGKSLVEHETGDKLIRAVNPDRVVRDISASLEKGMIKYLMIEPGRKLDNSCAFIVTTTLHRCSIVSNSSGVYLSVAAVARVTDRKSGEIVWENSEDKEIPLRELPGYYGGSGNAIGKLAQAANTLSVSEEEMRHAVSAAAKGVGRYMVETFREDLVEARKDKSS